MSWFRGRLTYANVISTLALFLALGGATAIAAGELGKNSVGTKQLKAGAVTTTKLKKNAVATAKIRRGAVSTAKIRGNAVTGAKANEATFDQVPSAAFAVTAESAAPRAHAKVLANAAGGGVEKSLAKGIADHSVTFVGGSVYCFELGFAPRNVQATVAWVGGGTNTFAQAELGRYDQCPVGSDASVRTTDSAGAGIGTVGFFVSFDG